MKLYVIEFQEEGKAYLIKAVYAKHGTLLTEAAERADFKLRASCGSAGICGKCKVIIDGKIFLACQTKVESSLSVVIPSSSLKQEENVTVQTVSKLNTAGSTTRKGHRYGVAVDIGTTTLAAELHSLEKEGLLATVARANPQRNFGDDVISRIQKVIEEPEYLAKLQSIIVRTVNEMIAELAEKAGISVTDVSLVTVAGNTVMEHLFLGIDPSPLGFAPFSAPVSVYPSCLGKVIGLKIAPQGIVETVPIFGGFVGGDIVAGVLAVKHLEEKPKPIVFLIDIGTNGELVLSHHGELYTAATAAGPAFEGARIEYGTLAVPGAIDHVEIRGNEVHVSTIGNLSPIGLCGSGLIDAVAEMLKNGLIKPSGQFNVKPDSPFLRYWKMTDGKPTFMLAEGNEPILLTQKDIRQVQLATGAIRAGIQLLLQQREIKPEEIETFYVAGGFGNFINPESAQRIGLLPKEIPLERIEFCGNTSLAGARLMLQHPQCSEEALRWVQQNHHLELAALPHFAKAFADAMMFDY